jgi:hypothetical protein
MKHIMSVSSALASSSDARATCPILQALYAVNAETMGGFFIV